MMNTVSYVFDEDLVLAYVNKSLIAQGRDFKKVAAKANEFAKSLQQEEKRISRDNRRKEATHVTTPDGMTGVILGRTPGVWAEEITVRFDNGQLRRFLTHKEDGLKYHTEKVAKNESFADQARNILRKETAVDKDSLYQRYEELNDLQKRVAMVVANDNVPYSVGQELHNIFIEANLEKQQIVEILDHLMDRDSYTPPQRAYAAVEQASMGRSDDWLSIVAEEMAHESAQQDWDELLKEEPVRLIASLDDGPLSSLETVRELAREHIYSKTAAFRGDDVEKFRNQFVARAVALRDRELKLRKKMRIEKDSKVKKDQKKFPDESLFL